MPSDDNSSVSLKDNISYNTNLFFYCLQISHHWGRPQERVLLLFLFLFFETDLIENCSHHDIAEKLLSLRLNINHSLCIIIIYVLSVEKEPSTRAAETTVVIETTEATTQFQKTETKTTTTLLFQSLQYFLRRRMK
jgi:hypothetical protein